MWFFTKNVLKLILKQALLIRYVHKCSGFGNWIQKVIKVPGGWMAKLEGDGG
jgi:hypothetical protein